MKQEAYKFQNIAQISYQAAKKIVPVINEIIGVPKSVVDLGGGCGGWCLAFKENGSQLLRCIDHPSLKKEDLLISEKEFEPCDLDRSLPPVKKCDLAVSIEFVEHVDKTRSEAVIEFLTNSSTVVLFSAAVPRQGGVGHINEQRVRYWKKLFEEREFLITDVIRPRILFDSSIPNYLRQNLYLYVHKDTVNRLCIPSDSLKFIPDEFEMVDLAILESPLLVSEILKELPQAVIRAIRYRLKL
ncbi:MAG: hypothetical protein HY739_08840 [Desulfobacterales bacterium]|nr:hypothetical protein [Desulfobacterales bacterium]